MALRIRLVLRDTEITWILSSYALGAFSFFMTLITLITVKKLTVSLIRRLKKKKIERQLPPPGGVLDKCLDPKKVYELVDAKVGVVVRQMLKAPPEGGPLVITGPVSVLIMAHLVSTTVVKQVEIGVINLALNDVKRDLWTMLTGSTLAVTSFLTPWQRILILLPVPINFVTVLSWTTSVVIASMIVNKTLEPNIECEQFLSPLPGTEIQRSSEQSELPTSVAYLDIPSEKTPKIIVKGSETTEIYVPDHSKQRNLRHKVDVDQCLHDLMNTQDETKTKKWAQPYQSFANKPKSIERHCKKKFVPLNKRTKTLSDFRSENETFKMEKAESAIKRYEKRVVKYEKQRERIMRERNK